MRIALIGHRGVGKSTLLKKIRSLAVTECIDLDEEIERSLGKSISQIFSDFGEEHFRKLEIEFVQKLCAAQTDCVIALGAGCELAQVALYFSKLVWIRTDLDHQERLFVDRPTLAGMSWPQRFQQREQRYQSFCTDVLWLRPGSHLFTNDAVDLCLSKMHGNHQLLNGCNFVMTVDTEMFSKIFSNISLWLAQGWIFELRDDLLAAELINQLATVIPSQQLMVTLRKDSSELILEQAWNKAKWRDWDCSLRKLEAGFQPPSIISSHSQQPPQGEAEQILKWSPVLDSWSAIKTANDWLIRTPKAALFPRSEQELGLWKWYRLRLQNKLPFQFVRTISTRAGLADQPNETEALHYHHFRDWSRWGAVLGWPVNHSYGPVMHSGRAGTPYLAVPVSQNEWRQAFAQLQEWGLYFASITSPHKQQPELLIAGAQDQRIVELQSVNTWSHSPGVTNTDLDGLKVFLKGLADTESTVVIGGGGLLQVLKKLLPKAHFQPLRAWNTKPPLRLNTQFIVWAGGEHPFHLPKDEFKVEKVFDLSYSPQSTGRKIAIAAGAEYQSGEPLFIAQAEKQQEFWGFSKTTTN